MLEKKTTLLSALLLLVVLSVLLFPANISAYSPEIAERALSQGPMGIRKLNHDQLAAVGSRIKQGLNVRTGGVASKTAAGYLSSYGKKGIYSSKTTGTPYFINRSAMELLDKGAQKTSPGVSGTDRALGFIEYNSDVFLLGSPRDELELVSTTETADGKQHFRFQQLYCGVPVWGQQLVVHLDANGNPYAFNGRYIPTPSSLDVSISIMNAVDAVERSLEHLSQTVEIIEFDDTMKRLLAYDGPTTEKTVWVKPSSGEVHSAWHVLIRPDMRDVWHYFIDDYTGTVLDSYNATAWQTPETATATDALGEIRTFNVALDNAVYTMYDIEASIKTYDAHGRVIRSNNYPTLVKSSDNTWTDTVAVSAHANVRTVYDYYFEEHERKGLDGGNGTVQVFIHFTEDGSPLDNAFWNGQFIAFGDGRPYAAALDVVAHELTHGVVEHTAGLEYRYQSGALNEAISDIMAAMVDPDWQIGEDLPGGPLRDLSQPSEYGLPEHMDEYRDYPLSYDFGGVHINMSIPSKAGYLMAVTLGREKTAAIWYRALDSRYLTSHSEFVDVRFATIRAAEDLYGEGSDESAVVAESFDSVGIYEDTGTVPPEDVQPVRGDEIVAFVAKVNGSSRLALAPLTLEDSDDIVYPTATRVFSEGSGPVTVCRDGSVLMFIDNANNIRLIDLNTNEESVIEETGSWSSIKLSPNGRLIAATTVNADSTIYIIDIEEPENSTSFHLYTASTEGVKSYNTLLADALDWDMNSTTVLYDAFHSIPLGEGVTVESWDVNMLDIGTGIITRVSTPTDHNTQVGNPSFAETNDRYIVCDLFSEDLGTSELVTIDLFSYEMKVLRENGMIQLQYPNLGHPKYSPDDKHIVFQQYSQFYQAFIIYTIPLNDDKMTASGDESAYWFGELPLWFARREPTSVDETETVYPETFTLHQNSPNPFNPATVITFDLHEPVYVTLSIYDILGRRIDTLIDHSLSAGVHEVYFDASQLASGTYFYQLRSGRSSTTKKMTVMK